jgi:putative sigma-54 modulation protein
MLINITGHHIEITPAMRGRVETKFERLLRHFERVIDIHCILSVDKLQQKAEATIHLSGHTLHADAVDLNLYTAIDLLVDKLDRMAIKHKEKTGDHHAAEAQRGRL